MLNSGTSVLVSVVVELTSRPSPTALVLVTEEMVVVSAEVKDVKATRAVELLTADVTLSRSPGAMMLLAGFVVPVLGVVKVVSNDVRVASPT